MERCDVCGGLKYGQIERTNDFFCMCPKIDYKAELQKKDLIIQAQEELIDFFYNYMSKGSIAAGIKDSFRYIELVKKIEEAKK